MNIGFIGTGNMGRILIEAVISSQAIVPENIIATNRTIKKATAIQSAYPIQVVDTAEDVVKQATLIFICVKPHDFHSLLTNLQPLITKNHCFVSITSPLSLSQLERLLPCSVARVIPSITNRALSGTTLITFGENCTEHNKQLLHTLLEKISVPIVIDEKITRIAADITSCGPAFFSYLLRRFIEAAVSKGDISESVATVLATNMIIGLGNLLEKDFYTLPSLQEKVCVKGGITGEGITVLENGLGTTFEDLFEQTQKKFAEDIMLITKQFED